ncbi:MAG: glycosyltransferase family 87 protein [Gemmataceae bacterium]
MHARRAFFLGIGVILAVVAVRTALKVADNRSAFVRWQPQIRQMSEGVDISAAYNYPNPPIMAVMLEPLAHLPPVVGAMLWFFLKAGLATLSLYWVIQMVQEGDRPFPTWAWMLLVVCSLKPILDDLSHGNVNLLILFLVVASLRAYTAGREVLGGVVLALAIACKVTPALFVPYFVWKRSWKALAGCVVGIGLFLWPGVVPSLRLGFEDNQEQLVSWYRGMVHPFVVEGKVTSEHINQSLPGLVARLATHQPSFVAWVNDVEQPMRYDNFLALSPTTAKRIVQSFLVAFALLVVWVCRAGKDAPGWRRTAEFALIALGMLLFSERTWKHHAVVLVLPFAVLVYALAQGLQSAAWSRLQVGIISTALVLMLLPALGRGRDRFESGRRPGLAKLSLAYGAYTGAFLLLSGGVVVLLRTGRRNDTSATIDMPASGPTGVAA